MQDGFLTISVVDSTTNAPIQDVTINIYGQNADGSTSSAIYQNLKTNESGQIVNIPLSARCLLFIRSNFYYKALC